MLVLVVRVVAAPPLVHCNSESSGDPPHPRPPTDRRRGEAPHAWQCMIVGEVLGCGQLWGGRGEDVTAQARHRGP